MGEGTVNDEELVEVIAEAVNRYKKRVEIADDVLAALRSAGFQVFRPEDCEIATQAPIQHGHGPIRYFLVPAESPTEETE